MKLSKKTKVTPAMRKKFIDEQGWEPDDKVILQWWNLQAEMQHLKSKAAKFIKPWKPNEK